tara:strand:+ start:886 stop:1635 length:750 start_codon:yes stop_codon:yes gene_type:complete
MGLPKIAIPEYRLTLPSTGKEIKYRPFLVKEEKLLLIAMESEDSKQIIDATINVIKNCIVDNIDVETLPMFDIEYVFLWLRARAKGELIELKYNCPDCKKEIPVSFSVEDVKVFKTESHTNKIELTNDLGIVLKYPNIVLQNEIDSTDDKVNQIENILKSILLCIDYIYDKDKTYSQKDHTVEEMEEFLESLNDEQFLKISNFFETMPKLKHKVIIECKNKIKEEGKKKGKVCGYTEDIVLEGLQSFFA